MAPSHARVAARLRVKLDRGKRKRHRGQVTVKWSSNLTSKIFILDRVRRISQEIVNLTIFLRYSDILNFNNLKPYGISNFTASTVSDAVTHRRL